MLYLGGFKSQYRTYFLENICFAYFGGIKSALTQQTDQMNKTSLRPFLTNAPSHPKWDGGYAGGTINPSKIADKLFKEPISGPWLTCYMLRRFGWPNEGSDDHKNLMSWALTTSIEGLFLDVTPYLGGSNLHFGVRFTEAIGKKMDFDPGREAYQRRVASDHLRWWNREGNKKYVLAGAKPNDPKETLVHEYNTHKGKVWGLYLRKPCHKPKHSLREHFKKVPMVQWWIGNFRVKKLGHKLPEMTKREIAQRSNPFLRKCEDAIQRTMLDLLRTTNVRDIDFNIFGRPETTYAKQPHQVVTPPAAYWRGAGHTPEYWFSKDAKKEREATS